MFNDLNYTSSVVQELQKNERLDFVLHLIYLHSQWRYGVSLMTFFHISTVIKIGNNVFHGYVP